MRKIHEGIELRKKIPEKMRWIWGQENTEKTYLLCEILRTGFSFKPEEKLWFLSLLAKHINSVNKLYCLFPPALLH